MARTYTRALTVSYEPPCFYSFWLRIFHGFCSSCALYTLLPNPKQAIFQEEQVRHYSQCLHRKLVNAAPQRWSSVSGILEATIVNRVDIAGKGASTLWRNT